MSSATRGPPLNEVTIVKAMDAIRKQDFERGVALARKVLPESSTSYSDHLTLARFYMSAGRSDEAGKEFRRAVELGPGVPESWLTLVQYLMQTKRIDQAKAATEAARKALPADRSEMTLAQCYIICGDLGRAETSIQEVVKTRPHDPDVLRLAVGFYFSQKRVNEANEYLDKLDRLAASSPDDKAWVNRTRAALLLNKRRLSDRDHAMRLVEQNLKTKPDSIEDQLLKASISPRNPARTARPSRSWNKLARQLVNANQRFLLAQLYLGERNEEKYQSEMQRLLDLKARSPQHLAHFVNHWIGRNQLDLADRWLAELKNAEPQGIAALELEARLLDSRKRKPELLALLEAQAAKSATRSVLWPTSCIVTGSRRRPRQPIGLSSPANPEQPERVLALAQFLSSQNRVAEAMEILKKAWTNCRPEQVAAAALLLYDAPLADEQQRGQVEAWVAEAVRRRPESDLLTARLATIWIRQGRFHEAEALCGDPASNPDNAGALNALAWLLALRDQGKSQEAIELIDHAIEVLGENPSLVDTRAVARIQSGQVDRAIEELRAIRKQAPANPSFALHLAWAYRERPE